MRANARKHWNKNSRRILPPSPTNQSPPIQPIPLGGCWTHPSSRLKRIPGGGPTLTTHTLWVKFGSLVGIRVSFGLIVPTNPHPNRMESERCIFLFSGPATFLPIPTKNGWIALKFNSQVQSLFTCRTKQPNELSSDFCFFLFPIPQ